MPIHAPRPAHPRRATAALELALLLPILCCLFGAAVDFARVFYSDLTVVNCARNAAVYASQDPTTAKDTEGIKAAARRDATNLDQQELTVTSTVNDSANPTTVT